MKLSKHVKKGVWIGVVSAVALSAAWSLRGQPVPVATAQIARGTLAATVSGEGRTRVRDLYVVAAPVDGQLERVTVQPGDETHADDAVAMIQPMASRPLDARTRAEANAAALAAKAAVVQAVATEQEARAALEHASSQLETTRQLVERDSLPPDELTHRGHEFEMRRSAVAAAIAAAGQARAELARARAVLGAASDPGQALPVRSPVAGKILRVLRESAGPVASGTPLVEVGDTARLEVSADLLSSDAAEVHPGAIATITGWGGAHPLGARVRRVDPSAFTKISALGLEEQRVRVVLDLTDPAPPGLGHDYRVDVSIVVWETRDALRVPATALFRSSERWTVFTIRNGRARLSPIEVGPSDGKWTVVTSGLSNGEIAVVQPSDEIQDGTRVRSESRR